MQNTYTLFRKAIYIFMAAVLLQANSNVLLAQFTYGDVLFRVNAGGYEIEDTEAISWEVDDFDNPSGYTNATETGNKVYTTTEEITLGPSVPAGTPMEIFQYERSVEFWDIPSLDWTFSVPAGQAVEVRLFFAEIYFDEATRVFHIDIDGNRVLSDFNPFTEAGGKNIGIMKAFDVTSDGELNISLVRSANQPNISGIEIVEKEFEATSTASAYRTADLVTVFPNPASGIFHLNTNGRYFEDVQVFNHLGEEVKNAAAFNVIDLSAEPAGIYFMKVYDHSGKLFQVLRLVKQS